MQNTRRSASYSEKGPIKCRRNPFDLLFVLIMINIIHPKRRAGAFYSFFWKCKIFRSGKDCWLSVHCLCFNCSSATFLWPKVFGGRGRLFAPIESSSGIVRRIENLTKLLKIPHSQKARGLSRAGMILMVGIGQYWLIYIETKFSEWLLVWQWQWWMNGASNLPASRSLLSLVAVSSDLISRSDHGRNMKEHLLPPSPPPVKGWLACQNLQGSCVGAGLENKDAYFLRFYSCLFEILPLSTFQFLVSSLGDL